MSAAAAPSAAQRGLRARRAVLVLGALACLAPAAAGGQGGAKAATDAALLRLRADPPPVSARFGVTVSPAAGAPRRAEWIFVREADRVTLRRGNIDEAWTRDAQGRIAFERVFHRERRVVDYSAGELATLGVAVDWTAIASFVDPAELRSLALVARSGSRADERLRLAGKTADGRLEVDWLPALQLPARVSRRAADGSVTLIALVAHAPDTVADWARPDPRPAGYLRLDAADFGDMEYEPVVRLSEALDARMGWRSGHAGE